MPTIRETAPTAREIENCLFAFAPKELAAEWDNVGLLAGDPDRAVRRILVALDITDAVAKEALARDCQLICAHHPLMNCHWLPVQTVRNDTPQGRLLIRLIRDGISCICMHTNLDRAPGGVNDCLAAALGLENPQILPGSDGFCRMGTLLEPLSLRQFVQNVSAALDCNGIRYADGGRTVFRVATGGGACGEYADAAFDAGCDTFVTSDLKYHGFLDAAAMGLNLIDAGHFPTENPVCVKIAEILRESFPALEILQSDSHREIIQYA